MAERVSKFQKGDRMVGRILSFNRAKGFGFIRTADGRDIFLSSYDVPNSVWKKISIGDYMEFVVGGVDPNSVTATNAVVTKKMPRHLSIELPNNEKLEVRHIWKFGKGTLAMAEYKRIYPECTKNLEYVFIKTARETFIFNQYDSPVVMDGKTDVDAFYEHLLDLLINYELDKDYA